MSSEKNYVEGKVILITGGASGFGKALALRAAAMGGILVISDINEEGVQATAGEICAAGGQCDAMKADVTVKEEVFAFANFAIEKYGRIDVMVNNAGTMPLAFFAEHKDALPLWEKCIDINLKGVIYGISAVYDQMMSQKCGHIVNISSIYSNHPVVGGSVYQATKIGVKYISDTLRQETRGHLKVTTIKPTGVPSTGLFGTIYDQAATIGGVGQNMLDAYGLAEELPGRPDLQDRDNPAYLFISADELVEGIIYAINQPDGICISDITVRATNETFVM